MLVNTIATLLVLAGVADQAIAAPSHRQLHNVEKRAITTSNKRGVAYNSANYASALANACPKCAWSYSWESDTKSFTSDLSFIPTLKDSSEMFTTTFASNAQSLSSHSKVLFSINEPDVDSQAHMDVASAISLHTQYMRPFVGKGYTITTPSVSSDASAGKGLDYLSSWITACKATDGCEFDACNIHWYGPVGGEGEFIPHVKQAHNVCQGKPVWVTEFGYYDSTASTEQAAAFIQQVVPELDSLDFVHGYAYFMAGSGAQKLNNDDGSLNAAGRAYCSA